MKTSMTILDILNNNYHIILIDKKTQSPLDNNGADTALEKAYNRLKSIEKEKEYQKKYQKIYREQHPKPKKTRKIKKQKSEEEQLEHQRKLNREWKFKRMQSDPLYRLKHNLKNLIRQSFQSKNHRKSCKTTKILGCSFEYFKKHIEKQWEPWMNWDNYGKISNSKRTWQIDHIIAVSNANTKKHVLEINHYTNLRPLCSKQNRLKYHTIDKLNN